MLPKKSRIERKSFKKILDSRKYLNSTHFTLRFSDYSENKAAVSVSKKVSKSAVVRNRIRRRVYSVLKDILPSLRPGLYLVVAKSGAEKVEGEKLTSELAQLFQKV